MPRKTLQANMVALLLSAVILFILLPAVAKTTDAENNNSQYQAIKPFLTGFAGWLLMKRCAAYITNIGFNRIIRITSGAFNDSIVHGESPILFHAASTTMFHFLAAWMDNHLIL